MRSVSAILTRQRKLRALYRTRPGTRNARRRDVDELMDTYLKKKCNQNLQAFIVPLIIIISYLRKGMKKLGLKVSIDR